MNNNSTPSERPVLRLDRTDRIILNALLKNAATPYTEIAGLIPVSDATVHVRMKKMHQAGLISGSRLLVDYRRIGYDLIAFVGIYLEKGSDYTEVIRLLKAIPELVEAHYVTGAYSIFGKIVCRNTDQLRAILNTRIQTISGVHRTETTLSLENPIERFLELSDETATTTPPGAGVQVST
jgi:Lrp/AsnC family transcriptional regulator for asnA, asnC and gidA